MGHELFHEKANQQREVGAQHVHNNAGDEQKEAALKDRIVVNSIGTRRCALKEVLHVC